MEYLHNKVGTQIFGLLIMIFGCFIFALGFNTFVLPNHLFTGGVTGISLIVFELTNISPAYTQWFLNLPLLFVGWYFIGNSYAFKIIFGSLFLPLAIKLTEKLSYVIDTPILLSVIIGGTLLGLGLGVILAVNGSTGGLDIPARLLSRHTSLSLGKAVGIIDMIVILVGIFIFHNYNNTGIEKGLYAVLLLIIMTVVIDLCTRDRYLKFFKNKLKKR
ncbi:MAG: putative rane protein [Haloplasmataceae bacterium]|nr:putative rane protein [Haloplasmataceae bacterium]